MKKKDFLSLVPMTCLGGGLTRSFVHPSFLVPNKLTVPKRNVSVHSSFITENVPHCQLTQQKPSHETRGWKGNPPRRKQVLCPICFQILHKQPAVNTPEIRIVYTGASSQRAFRLYKKIWCDSPKVYLVSNGASLHQTFSFKLRPHEIWIWWKTALPKYKLYAKSTTSAKFMLTEIAWKTHFSNKLRTPPQSLELKSRTEAHATILWNSELPETYNEVTGSLPQFSVTTMPHDQAEFQRREWGPQSWTCFTNSFSGGCVVLSPAYPSLELWSKQWNRYAPCFSMAVKH